MDVYRAMFLFDKFDPDNLELGVFIPNMVTHGIIMQNLDVDTKQCVLQNTYMYHYDIVNFMQEQTGYLRKQRPIDNHIAQTIGTFQNQMIFVYTHIGASVTFLFAYLIRHLVLCYQERGKVNRMNSIDNNGIKNKIEKNQRISTSHA